MICRECSPCVTRFGGVTGARHAIGLAATTGPPQHCGWSQAVRGVFSDGSHEMTTFAHIHAWFRRTFHQRPPSFTDVQSSAEFAPVGSE